MLIANSTQSRELFLTWILEKIMQENTVCFPGQRVTMAMTTPLLHHMVVETAITAPLKDLLTPNQLRGAIPAISLI